MKLHCDTLETSHHPLLSGVFSCRKSIDLVASDTINLNFSMREAAGQTTKSSLFHSFVRDTRDNALVGTRGHYTKISHEFAGFGGDVTFLKSESLAQLSRKLTLGTVR